MMRYTLCFLTRGAEVLLLHRRRPPNQGLWNGVGGRIEPGEAPLAACLREVREETGYTLTTAHLAGTLTWTGFEIADGGLYLFTATAPPGPVGHTAEGELRWWPHAEACASPAVVANLHLILPRVLAGGPAQAYHLVYQAGALVAHTIQPLAGPAPGAEA